MLAFNMTDEYSKIINFILNKFRVISIKKTHKNLNVAEYESTPLWKLSKR